MIIDSKNPRIPAGVFFIRKKILRETAGLPETRRKTSVARVLAIGSVGFRSCREDRRASRPAQADRRAAAAPEGDKAWI